jgi:hypothetical protein
MTMKLKPRHVFAALVLIAEAPILATLVAGWLISGAIYGLVLGVEHVRPQLPAAARARARAGTRGSSRHSQLPGRAVSGW